MDAKNELASAIWPLIAANISDQLPKLYLFDSLNRTMCGGDMNPYSVIGVAGICVGGASEVRRRRRRYRDPEAVEA